MSDGDKRSKLYPGNLADGIAKLQQRAMETVQRLEGMGAEIGNVDHTRDLFLMKWMYENILNDEQRSKFTFDWLTELNGQLAKLEATAHDAKMAHLRRQLGAGQAAPGLVLPSNVRRQNGV